jgi:uncharacterized MAPEG superfamily protein
MLVHLTSTKDCVIFVLIVLVVTTRFLYVEMLQSKLTGQPFDKIRLAATVFVAFIVSLTIFYVMDVLTII